eukprot:4619761-Pyramimonas_sp.AAC.1
MGPAGHVRNSRGSSKPCADGGLDWPRARGRVPTFGGRCTRGETRLGDCAGRPPPGQSRRG